MTTDTIVGNRADRRSISTALTTAVILVAASVAARSWIESLNRAAMADLAAGNPTIEQLRFVDGTPAHGLLASKKAALMSLQEQWEQVRMLTDTFQDKAASYGSGTDTEARIDFKIALFEARERLQEVARAREAAIPADLGIPEEISTADQTDTRLWQLESAVLLAERLLELGIKEIQGIKALDPTVYPLLANENSIVDQYPVQITFTCSFDQLKECVMLETGKGRFLALRSFAAERLDPSPAGLLTVTATYGCNVYRLRNEDDPVLDGQGGLDG